MEERRGRSLSDDVQIISEVAARRGGGCCCWRGAGACWRWPWLCGCRGISGSGSVLGGMQGHRGHPALRGSLPRRGCGRMLGARSAAGLCGAARKIKVLRALGLGARRCRYRSSCAASTDSLEGLNFPLLALLFLFFIFFYGCVRFGAEHSDPPRCALGLRMQLGQAALASARRPKALLLPKAAGPAARTQTPPNSGGAGAGWREAEMAEGSKSRAVPCRAPRLPPLLPAAAPAELGAGPSPAPGASVWCLAAGLCGRAAPSLPRA